ncbi:MAG: 8-oxoguanine deaminase [Hyphomicrobiales bacterium]|jgi:8-oxoguanine deaminase|nr:8-oxoguanine deaminase [Hyphomicrobiales bacterium]
MTDRTLLLKNALALATMDDTRREIADGAVFVRGAAIVAVGPTADILAAHGHETDEAIDLTGHVLIPGLVNTHHHMFQSLTRATPAGQGAELFGWLTAHYPIWSHITPEMFHVSAVTAMSELVLTGCTTSSDHQYLYVNGATLEEAIHAAARVGIRFHAARGAMSVGVSKGGLPPDAIVEEEPAILKEMQRLVERWHDPSRFAMLRVVLAPCSPFTVSDDLMRESATLARQYGVSLHTHLAENDNDISYSLEVYGKTPARYVEDLDWVGPDVWHAHCVKLDDTAIQLFGRTGTGVAHCPCSNMRLASGIAPILQMRAEGVPVGLGVDGSASADSGNMLGEARQAMLLARVGFGPKAMSAREALDLATRGGARVLNRDDIGQIAPGFAADMVAFDVRGLDFAGAQADPVAALVFCTPPKASYSVINGRMIVREGHLATIDLPQQVEAHNAASRLLMVKAGLLA